MASRGSTLSRVIAYFKEAEIEEALYVETRVYAIMEERRNAPQAKVAGAPKPTASRMSPHDRAVKAAASRKRNREAKSATELKAREAASTYANSPHPQGLDPRADFDESTQTAAKASD